MPRKYPGDYTPADFPTKEQREHARELADTMDFAKDLSKHFSSDDLDRLSDALYHAANTSNALYGELDPQMSPESKANQEQKFKELLEKLDKVRPIVERMEKEERNKPLT